MKFKNKNDFSFTKLIEDKNNYFIDVDGFDKNIDKLSILAYQDKDYQVEINVGRIDWEIVWELREYGVKSMDIYLTSMDIELTWLDDYGDEIITKSYVKDDFDDCEVVFDVSLDGGVIEPTNITLDFENSKITLDIY